jgi:hypothetical protein
MRADPVRREEVRLTRFFCLATTPADAWRRVLFNTSRYEYYRFEPIPELFAPLLAEVAEQQSAWIIEQDKGWRGMRKIGDPSLPRSFDERASWLIRDCGQCGRRFFIASGWYRGAYCSDHCAKIAAKASMRRQTAKRTAARRQLRAGVVCAYCHTLLFESQRSDRRFCSDICRVKWHRANRQAAQ